MCFYFLQWKSTLGIAANNNPLCVWTAGFAWIGKPIALVKNIKAVAKLSKSKGILGVISSTFQSVFRVLWKRNCLFLLVGGNVCFDWPVGLEQKGRLWNSLVRWIFWLKMWNGIQIAVLCISGFSDSSEYSLQFTSASGKQGTWHWTKWESVQEEWWVSTAGL